MHIITKYQGLKKLVQIDLSWDELTQKVVRTGWNEFELERID